MTKKKFPSDDAVYTNHDKRQPKTHLRHRKRRHRENKCKQFKYFVIV